MVESNNITTASIKDVKVSDEGVFDSVEDQARTSDSRKESIGGSIPKTRIQVTQINLNPEALIDLESKRAREAQLRTLGTLVSSGQNGSSMSSQSNHSKRN